MIHIHFIVNPIAGRRKSLLTAAYLKPYFISSLHALTVKHSDYKKHAIELTLASIAEKADIIVACGGDGTINEVASCLTGTTIPLGIIPLGSGNGLASNLNIPKNLRKALAVIRNQRMTTIDIGSINERYFFSNMGIGFDASVIKHYEASKKRTIFGYVNACLISLRDLNKNNKLSVQIDGSAFLENPFMILVSNSNEMGYSMSLTPKASLQDGLLDVLIIAKLSRFKVLWLIVLMLFKKVHWLREAKSFQTKKIRLSRNDDSYFEKQIDGEYHKTKSDTLEISVQEKSLRVITTQ